MELVSRIADWVRGWVESREELASAAPYLAAGPDWLAALLAPVAGILALGAVILVVRGVLDMFSAGWRFLTKGKILDAPSATKDDIEALRRDMQRLFASAPTKIEPPAAQIAQFAESLATEPALAEARARIKSRDFAGATDAVRAAAEAEARARRDSAAREGQLWRDLGLLESARSVAAAIEAYQKADAVAPGEFWTLVFLSRLHRSAGSLANARDAAARALAAAPDARTHSVALNELGDVSVREGNLPGAREAYEAGLGIRKELRGRDPNNRQWELDYCVSLERLASIAAKEGDGGRARDLWLKEASLVDNLIKLDASNLSLVRFIAVVYLQLAQLGGAEGAGHAAQAAALLDGLKQRGALAPADEPLLAAAAALAAGPQTSL